MDHHDFFSGKKSHGDPNELHCIVDCSSSIHLAFDTLPNMVRNNTMHCAEQSESGLMHTERFFFSVCDAAIFGSPHV